MSTYNQDQLEEALQQEAQGQKTRFGKPLPAERTKAVPGSEEKILVMRERVARGEQLYHPQDATHEKAKTVEPYEFIKGNRGRGRRRKQQKLGYNRFSTELAIDV